MNKDVKKVLDEMGPRAIAAMILILYMLTPRCTNHNTEQVESVQNSQKKIIDYSATDKQIESAHNTIDSLRYILNQTDEQILESNPLYAHKSAAHEQIDSLQKLSYAQIAKAYNAAIKTSPLCAARKDASVFNEFANLPLVHKAHTRYRHYNKQIYALRNKISKIESNRGTIISGVRNEAIDAIQKKQRQIDSLLNEKHKIIQSNTK